MCFVLYFSFFLNVCNSGQDPRMCLRYCTVLLVVCSRESGSGMDYVSERPHKDRSTKSVWECGREKRALLRLQSAIRRSFNANKSVYWTDDFKQSLLKIHNSVWKSRQIEYLKNVFNRKLQIASPGRCLSVHKLSQTTLHSWLCWKSSFEQVLQTRNNFSVSVCNTASETKECAVRCHSSQHFEFMSPCISFYMHNRIIYFFMFGL